MANITYSFSISNDFPNGVVATDALEQEIRESDIVTALDSINTVSDTCNIVFKAELTPGDEVILNNIVSQHEGVQLESVDKVEVENAIQLAATNKYGKLEVHESSRTRGTTTYFTGAGDDPNDISDVGNGQLFMHKHRVGDGLNQYLYLDFNIIENKTWVHEGYIIWKDAMFDLISFGVVPIVTQTVVSSGTNYNLYNNYLIVPAAGDGTIDITSDITDFRGGLVYMPLNENGNRSAAFWNADWNSTTKKFENIAPAPNGDGEYNMFAVEVILSRFVNKQTMLGNGFQKMQTADADELGQGMRLRIDINTTEPDHDWASGCVLTLYRERSV